eukprot:GGOE01000899.1.p1 GENE.GGOE01000899.1~~GGOE01000899.1.p1  ORF type:complete len:419 (+),score=75.99 GGOE01000899.1:37-1257(+)
MEEEPHEFGDIIKDVYLWAQIKGSLRPPEVSPMQRIIGTDLVEANEVLLEELRNLVTILLDFRKCNEQVARKQNTLILLPGPPQREILQMKVQQLLLKIAQDGNLPEPQTPRERAIVNYVISPSAGRPSSAPSLRACPSSREGQGTPSSSSPPTLRGIDSASSFGNSVAWRKEKLNVLDVDDILHDLRRQFKEEHQFLLATCDHIRQCLEDEMLFSAKAANFTVPTVQELTDLASKLEEEDRRREHELMISSLPDVTRRCGPASLASSGTFSVRSLDDADSRSQFTSLKRPPNCSPSCSGPKLHASDIMRPRPQSPPLPPSALPAEAQRSASSPLRVVGHGAGSPSTSPLRLAPKPTLAADEKVLHQPLQLKKSKTPPVFSTQPRLPMGRKSTPPGSRKLSATNTR